MCQVRSKKAYDSLECHFFLSIMHHLGFSNKFHHLSHQCISKVTYSILLNGSPYGAFTPKRDLRQDDPFSPYLFLLIFEYFFRLISQAK